MLEAWGVGGAVEPIRQEEEMAAKQFTMATLAGGVAVFVMGFLLYGLALADFFASNAGKANAHSCGCLCDY